MSVELEKEGFIDKLKDGISSMKAKVVGNNSKKVLTALSGIILANSLAMNPAMANEFDTSPGYNGPVVEQVVGQDIQDLRNFLDEFNGFFTQEQQNDVLISSSYIADRTGVEINDVKEAFDLVDSHYTAYINKKGLNPRGFSIAKYSEILSNQAESEGFSIDDLPMYMIKGVDSHYPTYDEVSPELANKFVTKAMMENPDKNFGTAENAFNFVMGQKAEKFNISGGEWVPEKEDVLFDKDTILNSVEKTGNTISESDVFDNLPRAFEHKNTYDVKLSSVDHNSLRDLMQQTSTPSPTDGTIKPDLTSPNPDPNNEFGGKGNKFRFS